MVFRTSKKGLEVTLRALFKNLNKQWNYEVAVWLEGHIIQISKKFPEIFKSKVHCQSGNGVHTNDRDPAIGGIKQQP